MWKMPPLSQGFQTFVSIDVDVENVDAYFGDHESSSLRTPISPHVFPPSAIYQKELHNSLLHAVLQLSSFIIHFTTFYLDL